MKKVMFICTANSCRSQMAEAFAREYGRGLVEVYSAGLIAVDVQPMAIAVMKEVGIDMSRQTPKTIDKDLLNKMDFVITLCLHANAMCPHTTPGVTRLFWPIKDPVGTIGGEKRVLREFRRARDEIRGRIEQFLQDLRADQD